MHDFVSETKRRLFDAPIAEFIADRAPIYAAAVFEKCNASDNMIGFIDGTVVGTARPTDNAEQNVVCSGHKRKHACSEVSGCTAS